jgi:hypothetical protein
LEHEKACCEEFFAIMINIPSPQSGQVCPDCNAAACIWIRLITNAKASRNESTFFIKNLLQVIPKEGECTVFSSGA